MADVIYTLYIWLIDVIYDWLIITCWISNMASALISVINPETGDEMGYALRTLKSLPTTLADFLHDPNLRKLKIVLLKFDAVHTNILPRYFLRKAKENTDWFYVTYTAGSSTTKYTADINILMDDLHKMEQGMAYMS